MRIFLVVGTLFPFDRLVELIDQWAGSRKDVKVVGQIGDSRLKPQHMEYHSMLNTEDFNRVFDEAKLIVTHVGMGIILKSLVAGKPIVVLPRKLEYRETTTDHQMATARALDEMNYVQLAWTEEDLLEILKEPGTILSKTTISEYPSEPLISVLKEFIDNS